MNHLIWAIPLLVVAALAVSSAATAFELVIGVSGALKAAWRLQVCSYALLILQTYDWIYRRDECRRMWEEGWRYILGCGALLGLHFVLFAASLEETSIAHSLILVSTSPIALILYSLATGKPTYKWEVVGVGIGFCGLVLVVLDIEAGNSDASWYGDMLALLSMTAITAYLLHAQIMLKERNSPLFAYFAPVNVVASFTAYVFAFFEGESGEYFSWINPIYFLPVLYLGLVPGILGHLVINYLLSYVSIILITVFVNLEPFIGSLIGWSFGLQATPTFLLWLGGVICIGGNMVVTVLGRDVSESKKSEGTLQGVFAELTKPFQK